MLVDQSVTKHKKQKGDDERANREANTGEDGLVHNDDGTTEDQDGQPIQDDSETQTKTQISADSISDRAEGKTNRMDQMLNSAEAEMSQGEKDLGNISAFEKDLAQQKKQKKQSLG